MDFWDYAECMTTIARVFAPENQTLDWGAFESLLVADEVCDFFFKFRKIENKKLFSILQSITYSKVQRSISVSYFIYTRSISCNDVVCLLV